jgi:DNA-binding response OmpR family regulator
MPKGIGIHMNNSSKQYEIIDKAANAHDVIASHDDIAQAVEACNSGKIMRLGAILDQIKSHQDQKIRPKNLKISTYTLNTIHHEWTNAGGDMIKLTEKETDILLTLWNKNGKPVSRDTLLNTVWGYVSDTETHTLETHIYRLRQKIEVDPSDPEIIITSEDGYYLAF